jgi:hypothetical protein
LWGFFYSLGQRDDTAACFMLELRNNGATCLLLS